MARNKNSKLSSLADDDLSPDTPVKANGENVHFVYLGYADGNETHDQTGPRCVPSSAGYLQMSPGLNIRPSAAFAACKAEGQLEDMFGESLTETDSDLRGFTSKSKLRTLAERTTQPEAIELLLESERAKPVSAGRHSKRDLNLIDLLERRLARFARAKQLDVSDLHTMARKQSPGHALEASRAG